MGNSDLLFKVGYGGWAMIHLHGSGAHYINMEGSDTGGHLLQVTGASISRTRNIPMVNSYFLPYDETNDMNDMLPVRPARSPIVLGGGTYTFNGDISFELTNGTVEEFFVDDLFARNSWFSVAFFDGQHKCSITNCVWSSITISCSPNSLVTMSISYQSNNGYQYALQIDMDKEVEENSDGDGNGGGGGGGDVGGVTPPDDDGGEGESSGSAFEYDENDFLVPYWKCGMDGFSDFTITFDRNVTPVFLNNDLIVPSYLRPGLISVSLSATLIDYENYDNPSDKEIDIKIGDSHGIKLNWSELMSMQYNMSSMSDTGAKTYQWNSISSEGATFSVFTIY